MKKALFIFFLWNHILFAQDTQIKGFADVDVGVFQDQKKAKSHGFALGQFDLFITSQIDDKTTFLSEIIFESNDAGVTEVDIERLIIRRYVTDYLSISAGKLHTPIGYWSNAYHHGTLIQPTINRPNAIRFEDDGGTLPIHQVGVQLDGSAISNLGLYYNVMLSNGLSKGNVNSGPYHGPMAATFQLGIEPVDNLKIYSGYYFNRVKAGSTTYQGIVLPQNTNYHLVNGGVALIRKNVEFITEAFDIITDMDSIGKSNAFSFFAYAGYTKFRLKPYAVFNYSHYQEGEMFFTPENLAGVTLGLRYMFSPTSVIKFEFGNNQINHVHGSSENMSANHSRFLKLQYCIGF